jgi:hypothetical protein
VDSLIDRIGIDRQRLQRHLDRGFDGRTMASPSSNIATRGASSSTMTD